MTKYGHMPFSCSNGREQPVLGQQLLKTGYTIQKHSHGIHCVNMIESLNENVYKFVKTIAISFKKIMACDHISSLIFQLFPRNFSLTSQLFLEYFPFLTYFSIISQLFLDYFSVISRLFLTSQLFSQLFLSCASHFSQFSVMLLPFLSHASQLFLGYRLDPSCGFDINCR